MAADCRDRRKSSSSSPFIKLVHPKGIVEILNRPTRASEVMKKYPRHCVTRPDFFKYPWIVVHPDAVLKLGCVFYVVPFHTMDLLLKQSRPPEGQLRLPAPPPITTPRPRESGAADCSLEMIGFDQLLKHRCTRSAPERTKVDCRYGESPGGHRSIFPNRLPDRRRQKAAAAEEGSTSGIGSDSPRTALSYYKKYCQQEEEEEEEEEAFRKCRGSLLGSGGGGGGGCGRKTTLKPCLRKSSSAGGGTRAGDTRVRFTLPREDGRRC